MTHDDDRRQAEAHQAQQEWQQMIEGALIEAKRLGLRDEQLKVLCSGTGIPYDRIH
jgi:hypothetical protein